MDYNLTCPVRSSENSVVNGPTQAGKTLPGANQHKSGERS